MLQLTWLKIHKFRNVNPGTELRFGPKFNVLLGKNASGKTTLLELIAAISNDSLLKYESEEDGFALEFRQRSKEYSFHVAMSLLPHKQPPPKGGLMRGLEISNLVPKRREWSLTVTDVENQSVFRSDVRGNAVTCCWGQKTEFDLEIDSGELSGWTVFDALMYGYDQAPLENGPGELRAELFERLLLPCYSQACDNDAPRFDEALLAFDLVGKATFKTKAMEVLLYSFFPLVLGRVLRVRLEADPDDYSRPFEFNEIPELARALPLLGFAKGSLRPQLEERRSDNGNTEYDFKGVSMVLERASGDLIRGDLLSFGQKRLLAFYWYLAVRAQFPVVADELANGLHHEWIEACVKELDERQSFLATQNPLLLDYLPAGTPDTTLIHCSTDSSNGHGSMVWRNFSEDEQKRLDDAIGVGIQQVSEILRSEGLW